VWKPPGKAQPVEELFKRVKQATGKPPTWLHSFFAGVDGLGSFLPQIDTNCTTTTNGRGAFSSSLAEYNVAAIFHFNKQIPRLQRNYEERKWDKFKMDVIHGKTVGFLGWGSIAQSTANLLKPFGVKMLATKRKTEGTVNPDGVRFVSKAEVAKEADFIVNALPSTPETLDYVNAEFLAKMKQSAVLINVGRGTTVNEDALADALQDNRIAGAALDVFKQEPLSPSHRFYSTPNTLLSNHNADNTEDYIALGWEVFENNYKHFLEGFNQTDATRDVPSPTYFDPKSGY
jgi:phosphoglycerate dehydrogenase-like enzyme